MPAIRNMNLKMSRDFIFALVNVEFELASENIDVVWRLVLKGIRTQVASCTQLDTSKGWRDISRDEIFGADGKYLPAIEEHPRGKEHAIKTIIHKMAKDDQLFVTRASRYLASQSIPRHIVVVIDNVDRSEIPSNRQRALWNRLVALLSKCRSVVGIIPLREYTLGNASCLRAFERYHHIERLHVTTAHFGEALSTRLALFKRSLTDTHSDGLSVRVRDNVTMVLRDLSGFVQALTAAIDSPSSREAGRRVQGGRLTCIADLLHGMTNSDLRLALRLLIAALRSWAFLDATFVTEFLVERDEAAKRRSPASTVDALNSRGGGRIDLSGDELLRLMCVGDYRYFAEEHSVGVVNIFGGGGEVPSEEVGRFPALIRYRILTYLDRFAGQRHVPLSDILVRLNMFGYTGGEVRRIVEELFEKGFVESPEGIDINKVKRVFKTRKTHFYLRPLCKLLVYLENMRNDVVIDYKSQPHECHDDIGVDLPEVVNFIYFILRQEIAERAFIDRCANQSVNEMYASMLGEQPLSWRLLRSIADRTVSLKVTAPGLFGDGKKYERCVEMIRCLRAKIVEASGNGLVLPKIPSSKSWIRLIDRPRRQDST
jgi:hypothetical protein